MPVKGSGNIDKSDLLAALAADLRLPFLQIKTKVELLGGSNQLLPAHQSELALSADNGLRLIEAYLRTTQILGAHQLHLEPVSIWQLLEESAHELEPLAKAYDTNLLIDLKACQSPVMADKKTTSLALTCLGESLIKSQAGFKLNGQHSLIIGGHRTVGGASIGFYGMIEGFVPAILNRARLATGKAHQPFSSLPVGAAAGVIIADQLCAELDSPLKASRHNRLSGLAAVFPFSHQLSLI